MPFDDSKLQDFKTFICSLDDDAFFEGLVNNLWLSPDTMYASEYLPKNELLKQEMQRRMSQNAEPSFNLPDNRYVVSKIARPIPRALVVGIPDKEGAASILLYEHDNAVVESYLRTYRETGQIVFQGSGGATVRMVLRRLNIYTLRENYVRHPLHL